MNAMAKKNGPWVVEDSKEIYEDEFLKLNQDQVIRPDGERGTYAVVSVRPGVAVLAMGDDGSVYLTRQFRYILGRESIEVVCGAVEEGESPLEAARREAREEAGLEASEWVSLGAMDLDTSVVRCRLDLFLARGLKHTKTERDPTETMRTLTVTLERAVEMIMNGEITHGPSSVLILKAHNFIS